MANFINDLFSILCYSTDYSFIEMKKKYFFGRATMLVVIVVIAKAVCFFGRLDRSHGKVLRGY